MSLLWIIALVVLLYIRTLDYHYVTDDYVERDGYLYDIPMEGPAPAFYDKKPSRWYRLFMIGMHCTNVSIIYLLWGWAPALLFAVHPMAVWGTVWVTGNYYATTAYFVLISYYILHTFPNVWGALAVMPIYVAALNSTICAVGFPFFLLAIGNPIGLSMVLPLAIFLRGKRFKTGIKIRSAFQEHCIDTRITIRRPILMTKLMAKYIASVLFPNRLGMFSGHGQRLHDHKDRYDEMQRVNKEFWSALALCLTVFGVGLIINPVATLWFFVFMGVHCQLKLMGQFYAQRYIYLPMIGLCVIAGTVLQQYPIALTAVVTFLMIRTYLFIPAWRNQEALYRHDMDEYPENALTYNNMVNFMLAKHERKYNQYVLHEIGYFVYRGLAIAPENHEVHMNAAAFYAVLGRLDVVEHHTDKAIEYLKRISEKHPLIPKLEEQMDRVRETINKGELGGQSSPTTLSRPKDNEDYLKERKRHHGTRKDTSKETGKGIKHDRGTEHQRREERLAGCT